jgi:hypothetical protein
MSWGGRRDGAGRPKLGNARVLCVLPRPVFKALLERENQTGVARSRIIAEIVTHELIGGILKR